MLLRSLFVHYVFISHEPSARRLRCPGTPRGQGSETCAPSTRAIFIGAQGKVAPRQPQAGVQLSLTHGIGYEGGMRSWSPSRSLAGAMRSGWHRDFPNLLLQPAARADGWAIVGDSKP